MKNLTIFLTFVIAFVLASVRVLNADVLVSTGPGGTSFDHAFDFFNYLYADTFESDACEFTSDRPAIIKSVKSWMSISILGNLNVVLRKDANGIPGVMLYKGRFTSTDNRIPHWEVFSGLSWQIAAGTYWISFEPVQNSSINGAMLNGAPRPLPGYAYFVDGNDTWVRTRGSSYGLKIISTPVPLPTITSSALVRSVTGKIFSYSVTATNNSKSYGASGLPNGLILDTATGVISGTPTQAGVFNLGVSATNAFGTGTATTTLTVVDAATLPVVTMTTTVPKVTTGSDTPGRATLKLSAVQTGDVAVNYEIRGTAVNGQDYTLLKGMKNIRAGLTNKSIKIFPRSNLADIHKRVVKIVLTPGEYYTVGPQRVAKIVILDEH